MRRARRTRGAQPFAITALLLSTLAVPSAALADQALFDPDMAPAMDPGDVIVHDYRLYVGRAGIPNVAYENAATFAAGETVVATLAAVVSPPGFGSVQILSAMTVTGVTVDWGTESAVLEFSPVVQFRYVAPTAADLDCDAHPGQDFFGAFGVQAAMVGSAGTLASVDTTRFPNGARGTVSVRLTCPAAQPAAPATDVAPLAADTSRQPGLGSSLSILAGGVSMIGSVMAFLARLRRRPAKA
jgi:hypothetical protein